MYVFDLLTAPCYRHGHGPGCRHCIKPRILPQYQHDSDTNLILILSGRAGPLPGHHSLIRIIHKKNTVRNGLGQKLGGVSRQHDRTFPTYRQDNAL